MARLALPSDSRPSVTQRVSGNMRIGVSAHGSITRTFQKHFQAEVVRADTADEALGALRDQPFDLVLVNRVLDHDGRPGLDFITQLKQDEQLRQLPVMLVSKDSGFARESGVAELAPQLGEELRTHGHPGRVRLYVDVKAIAAVLARRGLVHAWGGLSGARRLVLRARQKLLHES